jgi:putative peptidoglycan lipid II flippase
VLAFMLIKVLAPAFFARQDLKTPVRIAIICMVANMVFNLILIWPLKHVGLALATSLSSLLNTALLFWGLYKIGVYRPAPGWGLYGLRLLGACAAMVALVWWLNVAPVEWFVWGWQQRVLWLSLLVGGGLLAFVGALLALGLRMRHLRH